MPNLKKIFFRIETARKITQFIFFLLLSAVIFGLEPTSLLLPILLSSGTPQKTVGDAFAAFQSMLYQVVFPWIPLASFLIVAVLLGRAMCGWVCPFGFVQDILGYLKKKHVEVSLETHNGMVKVKYVILGITAFISLTLAASLAANVGRGYKAAIGVFGEAPFNAWSPAETLFAILPKMALDLRYAIFEQEAFKILSGIVTFPPLFWVRLFILAGVLALGVYIPRSWCRYICPHGAGLALLNKFSFLGLKREIHKCTKAECRACVEACPMKVRILDLPWEKFTDPECIMCLKCVDACSTKALKPKFP